MIQIVFGDDEELNDEILAALQENGGYCPCAIVRTPATKCMCYAFRYQETVGHCHCGLYQKIKIETENN